MNDRTLPYTLRLLLAVADELYRFAHDAVVRRLPLFSRNRETRFGAHDSIVYALPSHDAQVGESADGEGPNTFKSVADVLDTARRPDKNTVMYTGSASVPIFYQPTVSLDGVVTRIPYGAMLMVLEHRGRFAHVGYGNTVGWVLRDELVDRAAYVYPDFTIGEKNGHDDPNTLRVRACIEDEFGGGIAELPLQSSEYVLYRLVRKGKWINWPDVRPRVPGAWQAILKGASGIHMGIEPKEGTVMEYLKEDGEGHLAYVEAIFPDGTISITEADFPEDGIYNERVLTREEWRELHPVFIEVG